MAHAFTCRGCGFTYEGRNKTQTMCRRCRTMFLGNYPRFKKKFGDRGEEALLSMLHDTYSTIPYVGAILNGERKVASGISQPLAEKNDEPPHPCPYCGRMTTNAYCYECVAEGLHWIHQETGRTNGWDVKKTAVDEDRSERFSGGYRGRRMMGGAGIDRGFFTPGI